MQTLIPSRRLQQSRQQADVLEKGALAGGFAEGLEFGASGMATEVHRPAEVTLPPPPAEIPTKLSENWDGKNGVVTGSQEGEIPVGDETFELESIESNESDTGSTPRSRHEKAEAFSEARKERVEVEANAYLESEIRKVNARAHTAQALAEKKRMHEEAKALELNKREELRAEQLQSTAEARADKIMAKAKEDTFKVAVKADKIVENAKQEAAKVKAHVYEQTERNIADSTAKAEKDKAAEEEARKRGIAELVDEVVQMKATGELPAHDKKGVITRIKEKVAGHHHGS